MKQLIFILFLITSIAACKKSENNTKTTDSTSTTVSKENGNEAVVKTPEEMVNDYIDDYDAYFEEYKTAVKNNDSEKINELGNRAKQLYIQSEEARNNAKGDDLAKINKYMDEKTNQLVELTSK